MPALLVFAALTGCNTPGDKGVPETAIATSEKPQPVVVELRLARIAGDSEDYVRLLDAVLADDEGREGYGGVSVDLNPRSEIDPRVLRGKSRAELAGYLQTLLARKPDLEPPPGTQLLFGEDHVVPEAERDGGVPFRAYWVETKAQVHIRQIKSASVVEDPRGAPAIEIVLGDREQEAFAQLTTQNVGSMIAIVKAGSVISAPLVREPILGGTVRISKPNSTTAEAESQAFINELLGK